LTAGNLYQLLAGGELTRIDASDYFMGGPIEVSGGGLPGSNGAITLGPVVWFEDQRLRQDLVSPYYGGITEEEVVPIWLHEEMHVQQSRDFELNLHTGPTYLLGGTVSMACNFIGMENSASIETDANNRA